MLVVNDGPHLGASRAFVSLPAKEFTKRWHVHTDMIGMGMFFSDAEQLLEAASAVAGETALNDTAVMLHRDGSIRITNASGWEASALLAESGAVAVYRITRSSGTTRVEGRSCMRSCMLESRRASGMLRPMPAAHAVAALRASSHRQSALRALPEAGAQGPYPTSAVQD